MKKLLAVIVLLLLAGCAAPRPTPEQEARADCGSMPTDPQDQVIAYYDRNLIDPFSAIYTFCGEPHKGYIYYQVAFWQPNRFDFGWLVCGTVNAKNRAGGYIGQELFMAFFKNGKLIQVLPAAQAGFCYQFLNQGCSPMIKRDTLK